MNSFDMGNWLEKMTPESYLKIAKFLEKENSPELNAAFDKLKQSQADYEKIQKLLRSKPDMPVDNQMLAASLDFCHELCRAETSFGYTLNLHLWMKRKRGF